jgi:16S rRNA (cytidine1402-2'-O)-methyltransferase
LFYNTLFDENAACHLAMGRGFTNVLKDYDKYTTQECHEKGINDSMIHVDFMIGTEDLSVTATTRAGREVALCSDGGYPGISDPGYRLIRACALRGVPYEIVPGPSAVTVALLMSGLSTSSYTFRGFPPRGPGAIRNWFAEDRDKEHTLICYESPFRVHATLEAALEVLGDREAAVCIELTKLHERVSRGYLSDLVREFKDMKIKGEVALVIAGSNPKFARSCTQA